LEITLKSDVQFFSDNKEKKTTRFCETAIIFFFMEKGVLRVVDP